MNRRHRAVLAVVLLTVSGCDAGETREAPRFEMPAPSSAAPKPVPRPTSEDVVSKDGTYTTLLRAFDASANSVVVEPTIMMTGTEYCNRYSIQKKDGRCQREWITDDSNTKITLPLSGKVKLSLTDGGECVEGEILVGACATSAKEFDQWAEVNPESLIRVTVKSGAVTHIAEMYLP